MDTNLLHHYGLDRLLTDQDDERLWEAALSRHWPDPTGLSQPLPRMRFGVGKIEDPGSSVHSMGGIEIAAAWRIERAEAGSLEPVSITPEEAQNLYPEYILEISHPSLGSSQAVVHAGGNPAPLIGSGEARLWHRQPDGRWQETEEVTAMWIS